MTFNLDILRAHVCYPIEVQYGLYGAQGRWSKFKVTWENIARVVGAT